MRPQRAAIAHGGVQRQQWREDGVLLALQQHLLLVALHRGDIVVLGVAREEAEEQEQRLAAGEAVVQEQEQGELREHYVSGAGEKVRW